MFLRVYIINIFYAATRRQTRGASKYNIPAVIVHPNGREATYCFRFSCFVGFSLLRFFDERATAFAITVKPSPRLPVLGGELAGFHVRPRPIGWQSCRRFVRTFFDYLDARTAQTEFRRNERYFRTFVIVTGYIIYIYIYAYVIRKWSGLNLSVWKRAFFPLRSIIRKITNGRRTWISRFRRRRINEKHI